MMIIKIKKKIHRPKIKIKKSEDMNIPGNFLLDAKEMALEHWGRVKRVVLGGRLSKEARRSEESSWLLFCVIYSSRRPPMKNRN